MTTTTHEDLGALLELLDAPAAGQLPYQVISRAASVIAERGIEVAERKASRKQIAFQRAFFERADPKGTPCGIFTALGGNRSGKTFACGVLCFAKFLRDVAVSGDRFWCVAPTLEKSIPGQQRELWKALPRAMFGNQVWDEKTGFGQCRKVKLRTKDGGICIVTFKSADQDGSTFEQDKLRGIWIDERLPENIFNRLLARIVDLNGFILYSDIPEQQWQMDRLVEAEPIAGIYVELMAMEDNRHNLPMGAIEQASSRMTEDERRLRIKGEFVVMEGVVYKEYVDALRPSGSVGSDRSWPERSGHLVTPFKIPSDWPRFRKIDYGGSAPTACLWSAISPLGDIYCYREYYQRGGSVAKHAKAILKASGDEVYTATYIDPCAFNLMPGMEKLHDTIGAQYERGLKCSILRWPIVNIMGEHAMVQKVKFRLEHYAIWIFNSLTNLRREFRSWKYKLDKDGRPVAADAFEDTGPCHLLDCLKGFVATNPTFEQLQTRVETGHSGEEGDYSASRISKERMITVKGKRVRLRMEEEEEE